MVRYRVNFADPKGFYYPGEAIIGNIVVLLYEEEIEFRNLTLKFKGKSYCRWTTYSGDDKEMHWNNERYFKDKLVLLTTGPDQDKILLGPGNFSYPFSYELPSNIPPTCDFDESYVRYYMKIALDNDWKLKSELEEKVPFKVVPPPTDFSQTLPHLLEPAQASEEKVLCCCCCKSGPIRLRCQINKQAFHVGEPIIFSFELDNRETEQELRKVEAKLVREVLLISSASQTTKNTFSESSVVLTEGLQAGGEESWQDVRMNIPTKVVASFDNCKCVNVKYSFIVEVDIPNAFDPQVAFPITIASGVQTAQPGLPPPIQNPVLVQPYPVTTTQPYAVPSAPVGYMPQEAPATGQQAYPPPITALQPPATGQQAYPPPIPIQPPATDQQVYPPPVPIALQPPATDQPPDQPSIPIQLPTTDQPSIPIQPPATDQPPPPYPETELDLSEMSSIKFTPALSNN